MKIVSATPLFLLALAGASIAAPAKYSIDPNHTPRKLPAPHEVQTRTQGSHYRHRP